MTCIDFVVAYARWLDGGQAVPLSASAREHESGCARCGALARRMRANHARLTEGGKPLPRPDLSGMGNRIIAAHKPMDISLPLSTALRPAAFLVLPAVCLWGVSLMIPAVPAAALRLLIVFGAAFALLRKILADKREG